MKGFRVENRAMWLEMDSNVNVFFIRRLTRGHSLTAAIDIPFPIEVIKQFRNNVNAI